MNEQELFPGNVIKFERDLYLLLSKRLLYWNWRVANFFKVANVIPQSGISLKQLVDSANRLGWSETIQRATPPLIIIAHVCFVRIAIARWTMNGT